MANFTSGEGGPATLFISFSPRSVRNILNKLKKGNPAP
jgi:hypothetical protein